MSIWPELGFSSFDSDSELDQTNTMYEHKILLNKKSKDYAHFEMQRIVFVDKRKHPCYIDFEHTGKDLNGSSPKNLLKKVHIHIRSTL